jgi:hypothetical protein
MIQSKQKKNQNNKRPTESGKGFFVNLVSMIQERLGAIIGLCLVIICIFVVFSLVLFFADQSAFERGFASPYYGVVKIATIVVLIYTLISTADFVINFILVRLPADVVSSARDEFLLKMNLNVVRYANGNPITAFIIRLFNYVSLSPGIINSPSVNFIMGFISIFGVVFILFFKHVLLWIFKRFIKPIYQPILDKIIKQINKHKRKITNDIKEKNIVIQSDIKKQAEKITAITKRCPLNRKRKTSTDSQEGQKTVSKKTLK